MLNWPEYDRSLRDRGDITIWFSDHAVETWEPPKNGLRGAQRRYSNLAILTSLTLRAVFHLALRQTEGFVRSLLRLMGLDLPAPDHTTLSRRSKAVEVPRQGRTEDGPIHLIVDSSGLKIAGKGDWHVHKHGVRARRGWRKLHIGVDEQGFIVASDLTESGADDAHQVPGLLDQVTADLDRFTADGAYDTKGVYESLSARQDRPISVVVPAMRGARRSAAQDRASAWRNANVTAMEDLGRRRWRRESGYTRQSRVENTFFRYKRVIGDRQRAIDKGAQKREALIACAVLNRMAELGMPVSSAVR